MRTWDGFGNVDNYASVDAGARDDEGFMQHYLLPVGRNADAGGVTKYSPKLHGQPEFMLGRAHAGTSAQGARTVWLRRGRLEDGYRPRRGEQNQR